MNDPLEGTWLPLKAELSGEAAPAMVLDRTAVILRSGRYAVEFGGEVADEGSYAPGTEGDLRTLTLIGERGPNAGRTIPCIYQLAGDRLRVCYGLDGVQPTDFTTRAGDDRYLAVYRRA